MANVIIYSTPNCVFCRMAKEFFVKNNVSYTEIDVAVNPEKQKEMFDKSHQMGVPVIDIDGQIIIGFDQTNIKKLLGIA